MAVTVHCGSMNTVLAEYPDATFDAVVTDPPYGISFMGKGWDYDVPSVEQWQHCLRVLKPGGHLLSFASARTQHRMAVNIEDAGFEMRDCVMWIYGSGFPKSMDVSKAIDKAAGAKREKVPATGGLHKNANLNDDGWAKIGDDNAVMDSSVAVTDAARQWQGWGTALKPAYEPIIVARKALTGTVAANVLQYGTGAINIDGCRVGDEGGCKNQGGGGFDAGTVNALGGHLNSCRSPAVDGLGRWPANVIHDGSDEVTSLFPNAKANDESTSAARFFYVAKPSKSERGDGNNHPTVKPIALMRYLTRLVTPPQGNVLDPFAGSGTTGVACIAEGFHCTLVEGEQAYVDIINSRVNGGADAERPL
jgi:DNA modification methylase